MIMRGGSIFSDRPTRNEAQFLPSLPGLITSLFSSRTRCLFSRPATPMQSHGLAG